MNYRPPPEPWEEERKREEAENLFRWAKVRDLIGTILMEVLAAILIAIAIAYILVYYGGVT